jgi:ubiquinone/menaquinone biosynthesis C-methylase UbiE
LLGTLAKINYHYEMINTRFLSFLGVGHDRLVFNRRVKILTKWIAPHLEGAKTVLDVGSGDGLLAKSLMEMIPTLFCEGVEVVVRPQCHIPTKPFDGLRLPFPDRCFDTVMIVDVLHHTMQPGVLLKEVARVARKDIVIKDHRIDSWLSRRAITVTDWIANRPHGVPLPFNFQNSKQWDELVSSTGFKKTFERNDLPMYPFPFRGPLNWSHDLIMKLERIGS